MKYFTPLLLLGCLMLTGSIQAQISPVPPLMNFQGRLARPDGTPVPEGTYMIRFSLWDNVSGGTEKWNQTLNNVTVRNGTFAALLSAFPADAFHGNVWLEIKIGADAPLTPRQQLVSVAYAMKASSVADGSITGASIANGAITADKLAPGLSFPPNGAAGGDLTGNYPNPALANNAVTSAKIADGTITNGDLASNSVTNGNIVSVDWSKLTNVPASPLVWLLGGNSGTTGSHFLGTTDNNPLEFRVNNHRVMRYTSATQYLYRTLNVLGGSDINSIGDSIAGATIAGGGADATGIPTQPNRVLDHFGTVGGGLGNTADGQSATVAGGEGNTARGHYSTVAGGSHNTISGIQSHASFIGGGSNNTITDNNSTITGGDANTANGQYVAIVGGQSNTASFMYSTVLGGRLNAATNRYSLAAGHRAKSNHAGTFVWGDSTDADFASTANNQFLIRASSGVGINKTDPAAALDVNGSVFLTGLKLATGAGAGRVLTSDASGNATWQPLSLSGIAAGGDLTGSYPNPTIANYAVTAAKIADANITTPKIADGAVTAAKIAAGLSFPPTGAAGGDLTGNYPGPAIANNAVTSAKLASDPASLAKVSNNVMVSTGTRIGIGTTTPISKLHISGSDVVLENSDLFFPIAGELRSDGAIVFSPGGAAEDTGKVFLMSNGRVGIGISATAYKLRVNGNVAATDFDSLSDARYKTNIHTFDNALDAILNLRGVTYEWNREQWKDREFVAGRRIGFIAQEVEKILPELVTTDENGYKAVAYANVVPVLVEAVKTQQKQIETFRKDNDMIKAENAELKRQLSELSVLVRQIQERQEASAREAVRRK